MVKKTTLYNSDNEKLYPRTSAECVGYGDGTVKDALDSTGVDDYPAFSASTAYSAGDVVNYNGKLYKFTEDHAAGVWTGTDAEKTDVVKAHIVQELGNSETAVMSQKGTTDNFNIANMIDALEVIPTKTFTFDTAPKAIYINLGNRLTFFNAKVEITTSIALTVNESLHFIVHNLTNASSYFNSVNKKFTVDGNKLSVEIKVSDFVRNKEQENLITKAQIVLQYEDSDRACTFTIDKFDISGDAFYALKNANDDKVIYETVPSIQEDIKSLSHDLGEFKDNFNIIPFKRGYFNNDGHFVGSGNNKAVVNYPVKAGEVYSFSGRFDQYGLFLIKDTDDSLLDIIPRNIQSNYKNFVFTVPEDGKLCAWSNVNENYDLILYKVTPIVGNNNIGGAAYQGKLLSEEAMSISTLVEDMFKKTNLSEYINGEEIIVTPNQRVHFLVPKHLFDEGDVLFVDLKCTAILSVNLYLKSSTYLGKFNFSYEKDDREFVHAKLRIDITSGILSLSSISNGVEVLDFFTQVTSEDNDTIAFDKAGTYINKAVNSEKTFADAYKHVTNSYINVSPEQQSPQSLNAEITKDYFDEIVDRVGKFVVKTQFRSRDNSDNIGGFFIKGLSAVRKFNLSFVSDRQGGYVTPMYYYEITEADFDSSDKITIIIQFDTPLKTDRYTWEILEVLDNRSEVVENEIENLKNSATEKIVSITDTFEIPFRGYSAMTPMTVKKDGSGDFTTIQDAINSITDASAIKQYDIQVYDDFEITDLKDLYVSTGEKNTSDNPTKEVAFIWTKNWVHIRGMKGHGNRLYIESPSDIASTTFQYVQVIKAQGNCIINNFYVGIKGGRYAIHQESSGSKTHIDYHAHTIYKDLIIEHKGNNGYTNGSGWTSTMAQANGTTSGLKQTYINCVWISANTTPFYTHTNSEFDEPNEQTMINCSIICTSKNIKIPYMGQYWGDLGSGQKSIIKFIGCNIAKFDNTAGYGGTRGNEKTNNVRAKYGYNGGAELQGYGNTPMAIVQASKPCLTFNSVDNNKQIDVVGGTAYELLWEKTWEKIKGTAVNQGFCVGSIRLSQAESRLGNSQVFCLPYILGNCASSPKTLIVKVDEQKYTITFNKNYMTTDGSPYSWNTEPAVNNLQIIADINEVQPTIFQASFNSPIKELYTFEDCQELGLNASPSVVSAGKCLKRSPNGYQMWEIAQDGDMVEGVAGNWMMPIDYVDGDNAFGRVLIPKKSYFPVSLFELSPTRVGTMYKAANDGKLAITEDKSEASFITVDSNYLIGI